MSRSRSSVPEQKRRHPRYVCHVPVLCTAGRKTDTATVLDVAAAGLRLRTSRRVRPGATLKLHYAAVPDEIPARVVWCRANGMLFEAGVTCETESLFWVPLLLPKLTASR